MKTTRVRTLRGQIEVTGGGVARKNLIVSDGLINVGLIVNRFQMWAVDPADTFIGILSYDTIASGTSMNAGDNSQFGWTVGNGSAEIHSEFIDPDHVVNRDMFLSMVSASNGLYNYLIECQMVLLDDNEAIISIIKETSQS
jgi:hypothetical protein